MSDSSHDRFLNIGFHDFRRLAQDATLSKYERIGFPDNYRAGHEAEIYADIRAKLPNLNTKGCLVLDIGPGCSDLPIMLTDDCRSHGHALHFIDSAEMLAQLPDGDFITKTPALFTSSMPNSRRTTGFTRTLLKFMTE